jgi:hypothetical protein
MEDTFMSSYEKMYTLLFTSVTDALKCLDRSESRKAAAILREAQAKAEQIFIETNENHK